MDPANFFFFLVPEVLVCLVGGILIVLFSKEFMENRRAMHIGKNGTPASPTNYWGRYQAGSDEKASIVQIASRDQRS